MGTTKKKVRLLVPSKKGGELTRTPRQVDAIVSGYLCVHPEFSDDGKSPTGRWMVSHVKTGRSSCGNLRFKTSQRASYFMRLLKPSDDAWRGDNPYQVAGRTARLYQEAVAALRANDPVPPDNAVWKPHPGETVIVASRDTKTRDEHATVCKVDSVGADTVVVGGVKYKLGLSCVWITSPRGRAKSTSILVPNGVENRRRFRPDRSTPNGKSTRKIKPKPSTKSRPASSRAEKKSPSRRPRRR